jgi:hypothetical protein
LREALSTMMTDSLRPLLVLDADGKPAGYVSIELINEALQNDQPDQSASPAAAD